MIRYKKTIAVVVTAARVGPGHLAFFKGGHKAVWRAIRCWMGQSFEHPDFQTDGAFLGEGEIHALSISLLRAINRAFGLCKLWP